MVYDKPKELPCSANMHSTTAFINIGRDRMVVGFTPMQSTTITTNVVSSNPLHGEVYNIM